MQQTLIELARATPLHWVLLAIGIVLATIVAAKRSTAEHFQATKKDVLLIVFFAAIFGLFGSKAFQLVGHIIRDGGNYGFWTLEHWANLMPGVGVMYGGLFGGIAAVLIYVHVRKLDFFEITDILIPAWLLVHSFGRFGCFVSGCCFGHAADWGIALHGGEPRIPVQLFEAGFNLLLMAALLIIRPERKWPGILLPIYLIAYAIGRFVLEFFRGDMGRGFLWVFSTSQWISLLVFPAGVLLLLWVKKRGSW